MSSKFIILIIVPGTFILVPIQCWANNPPGPGILLPEVLILPLMMALTSIGGGYLIMESLYNNRPISRYSWILVVILVFLSMAHEGYGFLVAIIFGIVAVIRAIRMITWGTIAQTTAPRPEFLVTASPLRLILAGFTLIICTIFLVGMAFAFMGTWTLPERYNEENIAEFVIYQLAYGDIQEERTGQRRFEYIERNQLSEYGYRFAITSQRNIHLEYDSDMKGFTLFVLPDRLPFFPYNYFTSQPSYRADGSGQVRMVRVHWEGMKCPPDAPVVLRVNDEDVRKLTEEIRGHIGEEER